MNQYAQIGFGVALGAAIYHLYTRRQKSKPIVHTYKPLDIDKLPSSPVTLLTQWKAEAEEQFGPAEAKCMVVATSSPTEGATARTVLLQSVDVNTGSLLFGSSATSLKAKTLEADARCEAVLRFGQRQIRVRGEAEVLFNEPETSDRLFSSLPTPIKIGLPLLDQGKPATEEMYAQLKTDVEKRMKAVADGSDPPPLRPNRYVGFRLKADSFEFYSGGHASYINDRYLYVRPKGYFNEKSPKRAGGWEVVRLQA